MGWNVAGLLVEGEIGKNELVALPGAPDENGETCSGYEVFSTSFQGDYAIAAVGGWTVLADPWISVLEDESAGPRLAEGRRLLTFVGNGTTDMYGVGWYVDGELVRDVLVVEGEPVAEEGVPLPEEDGLGLHQEDDLFALMLRLTGVDFGSVADAEYRVLENTQPD
ncbi:hypothetical protein APR12_000511 [Nocardia amikacinitolerans]|uniref:hypothetical protein n=1 Tax=Nocardia amikacinitolerans TaxID=756689 RepID=UPI000A6375BE|nr:hypothetical protein [Nocardia amikacinitolerans]MCP2315181.1 hypothetical protein [Nocardia amikacinitolerans]